MGEINYGKNLAMAISGMNQPYKKLAIKEKEKKEQLENQKLAIEVLGNVLLKRKEMVEKKYLGSFDDAGYPIYEYKTFGNEEWEDRPFEKFFRKAKELVYPTESSFGLIDNSDDDYYEPSSLLDSINKKFRSE